MKTANMMTQRIGANEIISTSCQLFSEPNVNSINVFRQCFVRYSDHSDVSLFYRKPRKYIYTLLIPHQVFVFGMGLFVVVVSRFDVYRVT